MGHDLRDSGVTLRNRTDPSGRLWLARPGVRVQVKGIECDQGKGNAFATSAAAVATFPAVAAFALR